jgi:phospholipid/cholesterol/gamma-HCH transport system substrate-binding protein
MRRSIPALAVTGLAVLVASCGVGLQQLPMPGGVSGPSYPLHAKFTDVLNLPVGAKVREGVATIGQVTAITTRHFVADVTMAIAASVRLPVGTTAQIRFESPLGDDFVQLTPPVTTTTRAMLARGSTLPESATTTAPSIEDTLAALAAVLNGSGLQQVETIVSQLDDALNGNTGTVRALIGELTTLTGSLAANRTALDAALSAMASLTGQLAGGSSTIVAGLDTLPPAVETLAADNRELDNLVSAVNQVTQTAIAVADRSGQTTVDDVDALVPVVTELVGVDSQLGGDLAALARFERVFPTATPGDYLQLGLTLHVALPSALTAAVASAAAAARRGAPQPDVAVLEPGQAGTGSPAAGATALAEAALP